MSDEREGVEVEPAPSSWTRIEASTRAIQEWWEARQSAIRSDHHRFLPAADLLVDRWQRAEFYGFGSGSSIYDSALVIGEVSVGESTWIGPWTILDGSGGLDIGSFCSISAGVHIYSHDSVAWATSGGRDGMHRAPTRIGDRTYVGPNTIIQAGVDIGDGCVIGALSLVRNVVPSGHRAYGVPARVHAVEPESGVQGR